MKSSNKLSNICKNTNSYKFAFVENKIKKHNEILLHAYICFFFLKKKALSFYQNSIHLKISASNFLVTLYFHFIFHDEIVFE